MISHAACINPNYVVMEMDSIRSIDYVIFNDIVIMRIGVGKIDDCGSRRWDCGFILCEVDNQRFDRRECDRSGVFGDLMNFGVIKRQFIICSPGICEK